MATYTILYFWIHIYYFLGKYQTFNHTTTHCNACTELNLTHRRSTATKKSKGASLHSNSNAAGGTDLLTRSFVPIPKVTNPKKRKKRNYNTSGLICLMSVLIFYLQPNGGPIPQPTDQKQLNVCMYIYIYHHSLTFPRRK